MKGLIWTAVAVMAAAQVSSIRVQLTNGLELYQDADAAAARRVVMRVVDTKTGLDALAFQAQEAESALWSDARPIVNAAKQSLAFGLTYTATSRRAAEDAIVTCERIAKVATIRCGETPLYQWRRAFAGATRQQLLERAAADPHKVGR